MKEQGIEYVKKKLCTVDSNIQGRRFMLSDERKNG
jgi:hypothetical protein